MQILDTTSRQWWKRVGERSHWRTLFISRANYGSFQNVFEAYHIAENSWFVLLWHLPLFSTGCMDKRSHKLQEMWLVNQSYHTLTSTAILGFLASQYENYSLRIILICRALGGGCWTRDRIQADGKTLFATECCHRENGGTCVDAVCALSWWRDHNSWRYTLKARFSGWTKAAFRAQTKVFWCLDTLETGGYEPHFLKPLV